jgi:tetratricopeptide (TPR) repeat protein
VAARFPAALEYAQRSLALADALGDETLAAPAVNLVGRVHWLQGDFGEAADLLARSAEQMRRVGDRNEEATAAGFAGWALAFLGRLPEALEYAERGLALARELHNPFAEAAARMYRAAIHDQRGAWAEALADYGEAQRLAEGAGDLFRVYLVKGLAGRAHAMAGDPVRARGVLEEGLALGRQLGTTFVLAWTTTYLAACLLELDEPDRAEACAREALALAGTAGDKYGQFMASRTLGEVLTRRQPPDLPEAERALDEALRLQQRLGTRPELARTLVALAALRRAQGRLDAARAHLTDAATAFTRLGMAWDRARAEQALAALA